MKPLLRIDAAQRSGIGLSSGIRDGHDGLRWVREQDVGFECPCGRPVRLRVGSDMETASATAYQLAPATVRDGHISMPQAAHSI